MVLIKQRSKKGKRGLKQVIIGSAFGLVVLAVTIFNYEKGVCHQTGFTYDGKNMTASLINPTSLPEEVDAKGCDIGIYIDGSTEIQNVKLYGANYFGIVVNGDTNVVNATISNTTVHDIGDTPFTSLNKGIGVYYRAISAQTVSGKISDSKIYAYQKTGVLIEGEKANVDTLNNTVYGIGKVETIIQNGITYLAGASGTVRGNEIYANDYSGPALKNTPDTNPQRWEDISSGILLFRAGNVSQSQNDYRLNQRNLTVIQK